jgi:hypothetical protein
MKKTINLLIALFITTLAFAQDFKGNVSGTFGLINTKVRVQLEMPLKSRTSYGINMNYYLVNWKGPILEPFIRIYGGKASNTEGFFGQAKLIYGNLTTVNDLLYSGTLENKRWSTYGFGINCGYKFLIGDNFTIEPLAGVRYLSPPLYGTETGNNGATNTGEAIGWYILTGFPIDFQLKFGYQF